MHAIQKFSRSIGLVYLIVAILGGFGIGYHPGLVEHGNVAATLQNIIENETMFRWALLSALLTQIGHFVLVLMLYKLLKPVGATLALIMVLLVLVGIPISMLNEVNYGAVLLLLRTDTPSGELVSLFMEMHYHGINIVQIFWGLWLFPLGYLVFKSGFLPKIIGVALMIGGFGYVGESVIYFINPDFPIKLSLYLFWGELMLTFWLLIRGVNVAKWTEKTA